MDKAESAYLKAVEIAPENIKSYIVCRLLLENTSKKEQSLEMYNKALKIQPDNIRIKHAIARYYFKIDDI